MSKKRKTVAYGYVGEWNDGTLGWFLPKHLDSGHTLKNPRRPTATFPHCIGEKGILCKITIEEVPNRRRRKVKP